jgi:hypothetical protein
LQRAVAASDYTTREAALVEAYACVARRHNELGVTDPVDESTRSFYGRPFEVLLAERFVQPCLDRIGDPDLLSQPLVGSIDQVVDSTDVLDHPETFARVASALTLLLEDRTSG